MSNPNGRIQHANIPRKRPLDPVDILTDLAHGCSRAEDAAFWVLTSAAAYLNGYDLADGQGSTAAFALRKLKETR
jgi:hypothetical protein